MSEIGASRLTTNLMRTTIACFALALVATTSSACIIEDDGDNGSGPGPGPGPSASITPQAGRWYYDETTPVSTTCPASIDQGQASGDFAIDQASATGFRIIPDDGTAPFQCTTSGAGFDCPNRAAASRDYRPAVDAVVTVHATVDGSFTAAIRATGRQNATVTCVGSGCASLAGSALPCQFTVDFVVKAF
jgi:hypothetical protein